MPHHISSTRRYKVRHPLPLEDDEDAGLEPDPPPPSPTTGRAAQSSTDDEPEDQFLRQRAAAVRKRKTSQQRRRRQRKRACHALTLQGSQQATTPDLSPTPALSDTDQVH